MDKRKFDHAPIILSRTFSFEAAHQLPEHSGKCRNLHGHTYTFEVRILGPIQSDTGMLVDFGIFKEAVNNVIVDRLDHTCLNDIEGLERPTAETLAYWIAWHLLLADFLPPHCSISVKVSEGMNNLAGTPFIEDTSLTKKRLIIMGEEQGQQ